MSGGASQRPGRDSQNMHRSMLSRLLDQGDESPILALDKDSGRSADCPSQTARRSFRCLIMWPASPICRSSSSSSSVTASPDRALRHNMEDKEDQNELNNLQTTVFLELWTEPTVTLRRVPDLTFAQSPWLKHIMLFDVFCMCLPNC